MRTTPPKPLWGFGWAGWCLLAVAISLAGLMIAGVDVRDWVFSRIIWNLGWPSLVWFVASFLPSHAMYDFGFLSVASGWSWLFAPTPRFSLISMCLVLIALQVHPRRTGVPRTAAVTILGAVLPGMTFTFVAWLRPSFGAVASNSAYNSALTVFQFGCATIGAVVLWWVTRSVRVGSTCAALLVLGAWVAAETSRASMIPPEPALMLSIDPASWGTWLGWGWNPALFGVLMAWATAARRRVNPDHCCQACGYDLRGSAGKVCPECGLAAPKEASREDAEGAEKSSDSSPGKLPNPCSESQHIVSPPSTHST